MKLLFKVCATYKDRAGKWHRLGERLWLDARESMQWRRLGKIVRVRGAEPKQEKRNENKTSKSKNVQPGNSAGSGKRIVRSKSRQDNS